MHEVRRDRDEELEGFVAEDGDDWVALTVFHGLLGTAPSERSAREIVHAQGLRSLAERWYWFSRVSGEWRVVLPQESSPGRVRVVVGYYSLPGVETATITSADLAAGDRLALEPPPEVDRTGGI
jgi:hypothetical protein